MRCLDGEPVAAAHGRRGRSRLLGFFPGILAGCLLSGLAFLGGCGGAPSLGEPIEPSAAPLAGVDTRYRQALRREMVMVEDATRRLASHLARGEAELAASAAASIHDRPVLGRSPAADQRELERQLPAGFLDHDRRFRGTAAALSSAAATGDLEQAARIYGRLLEGCLACHSRYASGRFPGFVRPLGEGPDAPAPPATEERP